MSADRSTLADPMTPPRPEAARFDLAQNAWVLSRYPDVWAALREPYLWPVSGKREIQPESRDADGRWKQRAAMLEALSASRLEEWRPRLEALTHSALDRLPTDRAVDLFGEFTLPWGLALAMLVTGADAADSRRLADLGGRVFAATGESEDAALRADAASANRDPAQFPDPDRLLLARPVTSHVALGTGRNSCVGAMLIRLAASVATGALAAKFAKVSFGSVGEWRVPSGRGSGFCFPASVYVTLRCS